MIRIETEKDTYSQRDVSNRFRMEGHGHEVQQGCRSTDLDDVAVVCFSRRLLPNTTSVERSDVTGHNCSTMT